jgi:hypothetical protein
MEGAAEAGLEVAQQGIDPADDERLTIPRADGAAQESGSQ